MFPQRYGATRSVSKLEIDKGIVDVKKYTEASVRAEAATLIGKVVIQEGCGLKITTSESWEDEGWFQIFKIEVRVDINEEGDNNGCKQDRRVSSVLDGQRLQLQRED